MNPSYVFTAGVISLSVVTVKFCVSAISYPSNVIFCFWCTTLYGIFVFAVYTGVKVVFSSILKVLSNSVFPSLHAKSYPSLSIAFTFISVSYGYFPSSVDELSMYVLSLILKLYFSLSYVYVTLLVPSAFTVTSCTLGFTNPFFDLIGASIFLSVSPYSVTSSSVYVSFKFLYLWITLYGVFSFAE